MEILLLVGCLLSGLMVARGLVMKDMTRDEAEASEPGNHRLTAVWLLVVVVCGVLVMAGCGSFWEDQGTASWTSAEARLRQAEVARLRELLNDRESDLLYEATGRHTAEDALDKVRQALGVPAPISVVDEAARIVLENDEANAEVTRLRALMVEAVQADLDDDAFALEAAIIKMATMLEDTRLDAK